MAGGPGVAEPTGTKRRRMISINYKLTIDEGTETYA